MLKALRDLFAKFFKAYFDTFKLPPEASDELRNLDPKPERYRVMYHRDLPWF